MKTLIKKIFVLCAIIAAVSAATNLLVPHTTYARNFGSCDTSFLGLVPWDCNTTINAEAQPNEAAIKSSIWTIVANVTMDITIIAAYLILGYVIYGGYLYILSGGDPGKVATGKKALVHAFIGLAIVMLANVILNAIRIALFNANGSFSDNCATNQCLNPNTMVTNVIQWIIGIAGAVAVIFIVYGGVSYTTSAGDPSKLQKAKNIILYALIGLTVVALAEVITIFVSNLIDEANENAFTNQTIISKEVHEI